MSGSRETVVIGISAVSGGGKMALTLKVTELLGDAVTIHFDDYDDSTIHPENLREWFDAGADYNAWKTPRFHRASSLAESRWLGVVSRQ